MNNKPSLIVGAALILAVVVGGIFYLVKDPSSQKNLSVTGSARASVVSDNVIWRSSISRSVPIADVKLGYVTLANDLKNVEAFLTKNGVADSQVIISPVSLIQDYQPNGGTAKTYTLSQSIEIDSTNVKKITDIAKHVDDIVNQGILFQSNSLEYYYSKLNEARVTLLTDAITDARARATAMAKSSGQSVGKLQSATSGVVQVLSTGAVDNGDYGQYDTSKINKDITVTVRATFSLK
jgi:hypothetical protein